MNGRHGLAAARIALPALLLYACAGGTDGGLPGSAAPRAIDPGYSAKDAEIIETGPDGKPRYRLSAERIDQDPVSLEVELRKLTMKVTDPRSGDWRLQADQGRMPQDGQSVALSGSVRVEGTVGERAEPIEIRTASLDYDLADAQLSAPREVTILLSGKWLEARGMEADLKARRVRLESDVHGRFTP